MTPERILAVAGTAALLVVALLILIMLAGGGDDEPERAARATATPTPTPDPTPEPEPTPPPLTDAQREQRAAAVAYIEQQGYDATGLRSYRGDHTLRVLLARSVADPDGGKRAFFFVEGRFVGTDAPEPSGDLSILRQSETRTTLRYRLYDPGDDPEEPSGGRRSVRVRWNGTALEFLDLVPAVTLRRPQASPTATATP